MFVRILRRPEYQSSYLPFEENHAQTKCANLTTETVFKSGVRIVKVEVDEVGKSRVPHLLQFECGSRALVTVRGRPPLCLRCHRVGHLRSGCPGAVTYAGTVFQERQNEVVRTAVDGGRGERGGDRGDGG